MLGDVDMHFKIITTFYNVENWIGRTIDSIRKQKHEDFQCILVDDASTDATLEKIKQYVGQDRRFKLLRRQ